MPHPVVYWKMVKRAADLDDDELARLREQERRHEVYIEFVDGERQPHAWDVRTGRWTPVERTDARRAA